MSDRGAAHGPQCDDLDYSPRIRFREVIAAEYGEIVRRRQNADGTAAAESGRPRRLAGLSLSGGGIRSATFNLGVLQALAKANKLRRFDYLSTVSGGGYVGGWWSAWLARNERAHDLPPNLFPPDEDIAAERDDRRAQMEKLHEHASVDREQVKDSAVNAGVDPIHHLRLFSNFITPRKGLLSADTWRAVTITTRNIVLTWLILLPVILAAIIAGQAWFAIPLGFAGDTLTNRIVLALAVPALLLLGNVAATNVWMLASRRLMTGGDALIVMVSGIAFTALTGVILTAVGVPPLAVIVLAVLIAIWTIYVFGRLFWWQFKEKPQVLDDAYWRNRLLRLQVRTLAYAVFAAVILLFAGFGHILFDLLLEEGRNRAGQAGGWGALALSLISAAFTAYRNSPTGGGDTKGMKEPSKVEKAIFHVAPFLFVLAIGIVLSWVGNALYESIRDRRGMVAVVAFGAIVSAFLFLAMALYEFRPRQKGAVVGLLALLWIAAVAVALWVDIEPRILILAGAFTLAVLAVVLVIRAWTRKRWWIVGYAALLLAFAALFYSFKNPGRPIDEHLPRYVIAGFLATFFLLLLEVRRGESANTRCIALSFIGCTIFALVGMSAYIAGPTGLSILTLVSLVSICLGWVVAMGWLADPNALTIHAFYKARLIRAYLGASNAERRAATQADVTDAVPGDDVLLVDLKNTDHGAPYHLVNTMLNLVGGSDLSTQARASDSFLMSKLYCGSVRTGFRRTSEYACGSISLGTAVAVSGAAASPTMGAQTPSAALTILMTLFNVRTGYWTPTPNLSYWRSASTRLWPFYTLKELTAQTTDLLPYSYLTDGGHYENTGAYSLIERGCNLIVVGECGADPDTTLDDLGNMIRKVRIDFGTKVLIADEDIAKLRAKPPGTHVVVGKILYDERHAATIGLPADELEGTIVIIKPNLSGDEPVDVKQYGYLNDTFPQQQTFDLFYDEAQFESYRSLGFLSAELAVATGRI